MFRHRRNPQRFSESGQSLIAIRRFDRCANCWRAATASTLALKTPAALLGSGLFHFKEPQRIVERKPEHTWILADHCSGHDMEDVVVSLLRDASTVSLQQFPEISFFGIGRLRTISRKRPSPKLYDAITNRPEACASVESCP